MLRRYLNTTKLSILEVLFEELDGVSEEELQSKMPRGAKNFKKELNELVEDKVVKFVDGKYVGNIYSKIFIWLFNMDLKLEARAYMRKKMMRANLLKEKFKGVQHDKS